MNNVETLQHQIKRQRETWDRYVTLLTQLDRNEVKLEVLARARKAAETELRLVMELKRVYRED